MNDLVERYEFMSERAQRLEESMGELKLTHEAEKADRMEKQAVQSEMENGRRLEAEKRVVDIEEELRKVKKDLNRKLRSRDADITERDTKIEEGKSTLVEKEKMNNSLRDMIDALKQDIELKNKGLESFRYHCTLFWEEDPNKVFDPRHPEKRSRPRSKPKISEEKDEGMGSEINTTSDASNVDLQSSTAGVWGDTSCMDTTCGQNNTTLETQTSRQRGEKRKKVEMKGIEKVDEAEKEKSDDSSEESFSSCVSGDEKEPNKKKKLSKNKASKKGVTQRDLNKLMEELKIEHQKQMKEQEKRNQEGMENLKRELEQKSYQEIETLKRNLNTEGVAPQEPNPEEDNRGGMEITEEVQNPQISSQEVIDRTQTTQQTQAQKSELVRETPTPQNSGDQTHTTPTHDDPPTQNREEGSPLIVTITEENKSRISNTHRGLLLNKDGTLTMTPQYWTWSINPNTQLQKLFKVVPEFPAEVNSVGHPKATRQNLVWTHEGEWILVPVDKMDKGPVYKDSLIARIERYIDLDGNIRRAVSYGDDETKLKVWFDIEEMKDAFPYWNIPNPSIFYNGKKFSSGLRRPKGAGNPTPKNYTKPRDQSAKDIKGNKGSQQAPKNKGYNGNQNRGRPETYQEWDRQQNTGTNAPRSNQQWEQSSWNEYQQHQYQHHTPALLPTPTNQHQYQHPVSAPVPTPNNQHQYQHPAPTPALVTAPNNQHQYQHQYQHPPTMEMSTRPKEYQSWDQSWDQHRESSQQSYTRPPRDLPSERQPPRESHQRDPRERGSDRRNPNQEDDYRGPQEGYHTKEYEERRREESHSSRSRDVSKPRYREVSRDRQGDRRQRERSMSTRRRRDRSPSPNSSGIGRGGGQRERDQGTWSDNGRGRGGGYDRRGNDASYGGS